MYFWFWTSFVINTPLSCLLFLIKWAWERCVFGEKDQTIMHKKTSIVYCIFDFLHYRKKYTAHRPVFIHKKSNGHERGVFLVKKSKNLSKKKDVGIIVYFWYRTFLVKTNRSYCRFFKIKWVLERRVFGVNNSKKCKKSIISGLIPMF